MVRGNVPIFLLIANWFFTLMRCHDSCHNKARGAEQNIFLIKWEGWAHRWKPYTWQVLFLKL